MKAKPLAPFFPWFKIGLVAFWLVMVFFLIQRVHLIPEVSVPRGEELPDYDNYMSIYFGDQKVGYSEYNFSQRAKGYILNQSAYLRLKLMGDFQELRTNTTATLNEDMTLSSFNFHMAAGPVRYQASGRISGLELVMTSMTGGKATQSVMRLNDVPRIAAGLIPYLVKTGLAVGDRFQTPVFDPATLSMRTVVVEVEAEEALLVDGRPLETLRLRTDYQDAHVYAWVDSAGRKVKEEGLMGLTMKRTTLKEAKTGLAGEADLADMVEATSVQPNRVIAAPRDASRLVARLEGVDLEGFELDGGRQRLEGRTVTVLRETVDPAAEVAFPIDDPALEPYLAPTHFIQSRDPRIINQARRLTGGETSPLAAIEKIIAHVHETLEKRPTMSVPSAVDVLETGVGDCNEHAVLAAALLRAAGVPARTAVGVMYYNGRFYYHAWLEVYYGRFMAVDPLLGQVPADAARIRFITGGLTRQTEMLRIIGRLSVDVLEAQ
jgi:hypothetical protein